MFNFDKIRVKKNQDDTIGIFLCVPLREIND